MSALPVQGLPKVRPLKTIQPNKPKSFWVRFAKMDETANPRLVAAPSATHHVLPKALCGILFLYPEPFIVLFWFVLRVTEIAIETIKARLTHAHNFICASAIRRAFKDVRYSPSLQFHEPGFLPPLKE